MNTTGFCLVVGGGASLFIASLHIALVFRPQWYHYFGADELAQMHQEGSRFTVLVTSGLALMFIAWGGYAFSGAGLITQLPLLRTVLIVIGTIYLLRGLLLPSELAQALRRVQSLRFVVFSTGSLAIGLLHFFGALA